MIKQFNFDIHMVLVMKNIKNSLLGLKLCPINVSDITGDFDVAMVDFFCEILYKIKPWW